MIALVGYTGFVGSNILAGGKEKIDAKYNSKNIEKAYGTEPDLLIYAGMRAEKYLANNNPQKDMELILQAENNIKNIHPKKLVLISTIDVFKNPNLADENTDVDVEGLHAYGYNRYQLERWVRQNYQDALIIRLPGLFGINIKKNFIYDYIHYIPFMLKEEKMKELQEIDYELGNYYILQDNGFYKVKDLSEKEQSVLKSKFEALNFSALNFTDSRNVYQFYNLKRLWADINVALKNNILLWHPATEPISAGELYQYCTGKEFINEISDAPVFYDYRTIYADVFGGNNGYICDKNQVLKEIDAFVKEV